MNDNEKYQKEAMRKYIQKLENQETKIVSTPQTELDKELKIKVAGTKKQRNKERNKALIAAKGRTKRERMREREKRNQVNSLDSKKKEASLDLFSMWHESCMVGLFSLLSMLC